jgi:Zn-dependent protease
MSKREKLLTNLSLPISRAEMFTTLYVAPEYVMQASDLVGADGVEANLINQEEKIPIPVASAPDKEKAETFESDHDRLIRQVSSELKAAEEKKKNPLQQIITLIITVFLFTSMGLLEGSASGILILVSVIFIHEMGHLISMRLLKYKDVQMFFIPLFGAAVSGIDVAPSGTKKAVVSLMGPVPGILIGIATGFIYLKTREPLLGEATRTFLFINAFNLLPFHPLDGGRFFEAILFSRHPKLELVFKVITTLALGGIALLLKAPVLGIFAAFIFLSLKATYASAKMAYDFKKKSSVALTDGSQEIPEECLREILPQIKKMIPATHPSPKLLATHATGAWQRIQNRPSSVGTSIGMTLGYFVFLLLGVISFFMFVWISYAVDNRKVEIITKTMPDGTEQCYEITTIGTNKHQEFEIDENGFFHGSQTDWHLYSTKISKTGQWTNGFRTGEFLLYDNMGQHEGTITYEHGVPLRYQQNVEGKLINIQKNKWPTRHKFFRPQKEPVRAKSTALIES